MKYDTPNQQEIDWFAERVREVYNFENLKDCDIDFLYNLEYRVEAQREIFEAEFPPEQSIFQGEYRAFMFDNPNETKEALTPTEKRRLQLLMDEITVEIHRAFGHRKELRRQQRNKFANAISDAIVGISDALAKIIPR